ncbi:MAG TPA: methionyl-tRNA formyltransferase [Stellaceae bacterium]|nr:methionyl-tRNA formyltransferase [Stellaceae bacterium]
MRIALIGQQAFGKAVLDAFLARGDTVAGVFVVPEAAGAKPDPLAAAARDRKLPVFPTASYGAAEAIAALRGLDVDLGIMAYVLQFVPQAFCRVPRHGTIQFHPSLLPAHRGPSSINWPVILGRTRTGLTIFRPVDRLDEGPVILQKEVAIGPDDTVATLYFDKIFPLGVAALLEAADLVVSGKAQQRAQDESEASYEGWVREAESRINWASSVDIVYNLIRGCNPAPGAWTTHGGRLLHLFESRKIAARSFAQVKGLTPGQIAATSDQGFTVHAQGGFIEVLRCRFDDGKKIPAGEAGIAVGSVLGEQPRPV